MDNTRSRHVGKTLRRISGHGDMRDSDLALRVTERRTTVHHVPLSWRSAWAPALPQRPEFPFGISVCRRRIPFQQLRTSLIVAVITNQINQCSVNRINDCISPVPGGKK
jgi:hypothetical protein